MKVIKLNSVGCVLIGNEVFPQLAHGGYDSENPMALEECDNDEFWSSLSLEDLNEIRTISPMWGQYPQF